MVDLDGRDVYLYQYVWYFRGGLGVVKDFFLALCGSRLDIFVSKLGREADRNDFFATVVISDTRIIYGNLERRHGGADDFNSPRCEYDFLGCNRQLLGDFLDKLPCQLSRS